jgi:tetratricopeptide (TPR) repeat protein
MHSTPLYVFLLGYTVEHMKQFPFIAWARYVSIAAIFLALVFVIPAAWFPLQLGKVGVFSVLMLVAGVLFVLGGGASGVFGKRGYLSGMLVMLLPFAYILSYFFSIDKSVGLLGYSIESDTVLFVVLCALAFVFSTFLFRRFSSAKALMVGVLAATGVSILFQFFSILFGSSALSPLFADTSVNIVGKWNDLGLLAGTALVCVLVILERGALSKLHRLLVAAAALVLVLFLALVQFPVLWGMLLVASIAIGVWSYVSRQAGATQAPVLRSLPWLSIAGAALSVFFLLWGTAVQGGLVKLFPVSSLEVRPALSTTFDIVRASHGSSVERFLLGTGPQTFGNNWFLYKPAAINQSQFWNLDFNVGYSTLATAVDTVGALGVLAWLVPLMLVLLGLLRVVRTKDAFTHEEKLYIGGAGLASVYLWFSMFFYVPSQNMILLAFVLSGVAFALSMKSLPQGEHTTPSGVRWHMLVWQGAVVVCVLLVAVGAFYTGRRYMAEVYTNQGLLAVQQGSIDQALVLADKAVKTEQTGDTLQFALLAGTAKLQQTAQSTSTPSAAVQEQFTAQAQTTINLGQMAVAQNPSDYRAYLSFGRVYDLLNSLGVQGAYDNAKGLYGLAATHNPTNPAIPLALSRLEAAHGSLEGTTAALQQSLQLKPDYTDAILFAVQLYVANKDINNAIIAAKAAVSSAPGISSIWFELGLLYYSANDTKDAALALEQAVKLQSDYANAKYFLGLSYAAEKRGVEAIQQFRDLAVTNPDNAEVKLILSNLEAGKPPFEGAQPPVTSTPQKRTEAPISQ